MSPVKPLISAVKSAVIRVQEIERVRPFYEGLLGLRVLQETTILSDKTRRLWGLPERNVRCLRLAKPKENFGTLDLIELPGQAAETIRQPERPWDYGWLSLQLQTSNLARALEEARKLGAEPISAPRRYEVGGKQLHEVRLNFRTGAGERLTLLQVGTADDRAPLFGEAVAAVGAVVPSLAEALAFYRDALGLAVAETITDQSGETLAMLLGLPVGSRIQAALLTAGGNWTGKYEFLQVTLPADGPTAEDTNARADGLRLGLWMVSVMTPDLDLLQAACRRAGVSVVRGPATIDRPCFGRVRAMIMRAPGGELLECLAPATGPAPSR